jgi:adenosine deaminase
MSDIAAALPGTRVPIRDLPKVSLHDHLDGGLRPQTIIELAEPLGIELPASEAGALATWFAEKSDSGSLVEYLKTFDVTISVMQTREGLIRVARDFVEDLVADGVVYGEIRWAPEQHLTRGLSLDETVEAVQEGIDAAVDAARSAGHDIRIGQLVSAMRHLERGTEIAELALRHRDRGVVGFDIAGPEAGFPAARQREAFDLLANSWFPALRLGHGVRIAEDITLEGEDEESQFVSLGRLAQWVKDRGVTLECSPSSNLQTGAFAAWGDTMADHPFDMLYQLGFRVTVNTDNRLMSATSLTKEIGILADTFGYDADDVLTFQLNAAEAAFLPLEDREELEERITAGFGAG